jgi:PAS domain-containing protein
MAWSVEPEVLFGFPPGWFGAERRILRALHPDERSRIENAIARALATGDYEVEYRAVRPDGSVVWIGERGRVVSEPDGAAVRMVGPRSVTSCGRR